MKTNRCIVIVLDSFGVGAMPDCPYVRPQDMQANTCKHILSYRQNIQIPTLLKLGLVNTLHEEVNGYRMSPDAVVGKSKLAHYGCDTYFGHQEIMGTKPKQPVLVTFQTVIDEIEQDFVQHGYQTKRFVKDGLSILSINNCLFIGDNIETDPGQAVNVTGSLDLCTFEFIKTCGMLVRNHVQVGRVIAFGGNGVTFADLVEAIRARNEYIGIDAPASGVYHNNYHVVHIGYGVDTKVQLPEILYQQGIQTYLYGKVADIVENTHGKVFSGVDSEMVFTELIQDLKIVQEGFFCLNIQETDLAGHAQDMERYINRLEVSDRGIAEVLSILSKDDLLIVMADHGNDPTSGNSKHTREYVPLLIHKEGVKQIDIGIRHTMADVGATVAEYFHTKLAFGTSFLKFLK